MNGLGVIFATMGIFIFIVFALVIVFYVLGAIGTMNVLKRLGYAHAWMAWIPFLSYLALSQVIKDSEDNVTLISGVEFKIPVVIFQFWWVLLFIASRIPSIGGILATVVMVLFYGRICQVVYSKMENQTEKDTQVLGYVSGLIPIIAVFKFLSYGKQD